jgi:2-iminoacetate synthase
MNKYEEIISPNEIKRLLKENANPSDEEISDILFKAKKNGIVTLRDCAVLLNASDKWNSEIFNTAKAVNEKIHHKKFRFYGVVYISDFCVDTCRYCGDNIYSKRPEWLQIAENEDLINKVFKTKRIMSLKDFEDDVKALLSKIPEEYPLKELCILSGDTPGLDVDRLIVYLKKLSEFYKEKIILNIPPLSVDDFKKIRRAVSNNILHFRVFQETYDPDIYKREHPPYDLDNPRIKKMERFLKTYNNLTPSKMDFTYRLFAQSRALEAGFDEVGFGVLFGLNDSEFGSKYEIMALRMHSDYIYKNYKTYPMSISFPRVLPSKGITYRVPKEVDESELLRLVAVTRIAIPQTKLIITCRESADFRHRIRPIINIEDYEARPGPCGNLLPTKAVFQMEIKDRRPGREILEEVLKDGYEIV